MRADKTAAEMDKQLNKCDASELLRTKANLVLRLIMRARGDCVSRSIPRDQETTRSREGGLPWINLLRCFPTPTLVKSPLKKFFWPL